MNTLPATRQDGVQIPSNQGESTIADLLTMARALLSRHTDTPSLDAQVLLGHVLGSSRAWLLAHDQDPVPSQKVKWFQTGLEALVAGRPLPYVVGSREFFGLKFKVTPDVLIPRPETELLVETARAWLQAHPDRRKMLEIGTGSGCISVSLAQQFPDLQITATDISTAALAVAAENAWFHGVDGQIRFIKQDVFSAFGGTFDLVGSNPPYIPTAALQILDVFKTEPRIALDGGEDGMEMIREILQQGVSWLAEAGLMLVEIESGQGREVEAFAHQTFPQADIHVLPDLAGCDRCLRIEKLS